jgi:hypothetical protein
MCCLWCIAKTVSLYLLPFTIKDKYDAEFRFQMSHSSTLYGQTAVAAAGSDIRAADTECQHIQFSH